MILTGNKFRIKHQEKGQILISVLIGIAVFSILIHTVFTLIHSSFQLVGLNRARVTARHLAQEKIENIRNMHYDDIGTVGGIPPGIIEPAEEIERNNIKLTVNTSVVYIDDPFDGIAPADPEPEDYKRVRVEIFWEGLNQQRNKPIVFVTDVSPGMLTSSVGGTLRILVYDAYGNPVPETNINIYSSSTDPIVDTNLQTNTQGEIILPGAEACNECYQITVTKTGFSSDRTYSETEVASPSRPHATVILGQVTQVSFSIDQTASLGITSRGDRSNGFEVLENVPVRIRGEKIIGYDSSGVPVYKYDQILSTNSTGELVLDDIEWDIYHISMPETSSYTIAGSNPIRPIPLTPNSNISLLFSAMPYSEHNLLVITKNETQDLLEEIFIRLYAGSYDEATTSGKIDDPDFAQTLFSNLDTTVTYNLEATASGYLDLNTTVTVFGATINEIVMRQ